MKAIYFVQRKNVWRDGTFRIYSYLRCSFLLFPALCIKRRLFYGPSFNVTVAVKVQYLTPAPSGNRSARQSQPQPGAPWPVPPPVGPTSPHLACRLGEQPSGWRSTCKSLGPPAIKAWRPPAPGGWVGSELGLSQRAAAPRLRAPHLPTQPPAMPRTTAIVRASPSGPQP